ncbi:MULTISPECIES: helix-turn-helix transcriptional regulator [Levilactobacillus]|uniref:helix-turn-helix domain-containing protein n=2 Tax=Bacilli TaxID=91061 RepID=UPI00194E67A9|nr:helix-turn-helix transcriptional regulator [Levilactobacillus sp. 244-2]
MGKTYKPLDEKLVSTGLRMNYIADKMGIDISYLYKLRVNPSNISAIQLDKMANATGIDFLVLLSVVKKFNREVDKLAS